MAAETIKITGARQHNLRNVSLEIPREKLVVMTGLSGSGKSSLAFDTLYAEGQRRYVESLSAYARQFLDRMQKPDVDFIEGLSPAIAIEQRTSGGNPRSTIATTTEIYDYLRLLYSSVGQPHDPATGEAVHKMTAVEIADRVAAFPAETRVMLLAPVVEHEAGEFRDVMEKLRREGFVRARVDGEVMELAGAQPIKLKKGSAHVIEAVVDRLMVKEGIRGRLGDSVETALKWGGGTVVVLKEESSENGRIWVELRYSIQYRNPTTGYVLPQLTPKHFSFNSHHGACVRCQGLGTETVFDAELVVPDEGKSLAQGAVVPWAKASKALKKYYAALLEALAGAYGVSMEDPFHRISAEFRRVLLWGSGDRMLSLPGPDKGLRERVFEGVIPLLDRLYRDTESEFSRQRIRQYMGRRPCEVCRGARLRPEILAVKIGGLGIHEWCRMTVGAARKFLADLDLSAAQQRITGEVMRELGSRLGFLEEVGLGYLSLDRESGTLSGGEAQRIRLATQIGSGLAGCLYVLDEPSIGLHQRDNDRLIATLKRLRDLGNTVVVVEHDEDTIRSADHVIDLGPGAGVGGGEIVAQGTVEEVLANERSLTGQYLSGRIRIPVPKERQAPMKWDVEHTPGQKAGRLRVQEMGRPGWLTVVGAKENNLADLTVSFPLGCMTCVTGVSGSGKSTLVDDILKRALFRQLHGGKDRPGQHDRLVGVEQIDKVIVIDQSPIGRTPRSNPVTYTGAFGPIRELFAGLPTARVRGYDAGRFSFNVKGGRCESCEGDGVKKVEMHFLADVFVECEACRGRRYNRETLEVTYKGKNISDILDLTVQEAAYFFRNVPQVSDRLGALDRVGLGYVRLGQSGSTLSGGEAQRVKLAAELARKATGRTVYLMDEPTTGLHHADIHTLLGVLHQLKSAGNTLVIIEHNLEVIKCADWVIDLGPEGGAEGGRVVAEGTPESVARIETSYTGRYLKRVL